MNREAQKMEYALQTANDTIFEQSVKIEDLESSREKIARRARKEVDEVCAATGACYACAGFFVARMWFYMTHQVDPFRAVAMAATAALAALLGWRIKSSYRRGG